MLWAEVVRFDLAEDGLSATPFKRRRARHRKFPRGADARDQEGRNVRAPCCAGVGRENLSPPSPDAWIDFNDRRTGL